MTLAEIFIPARTLRYGIYEMNLTVTMCASSQLVSSATTYIQIVPSPIIVNLIQFGVSMIVQKQQQMLTLNPGTFSVDPDASYFNSSVSLINRRKTYIY
jgi:K+-transporting ATPase A subunit